jgi:hypothetical protein
MTEPHEREESESERRAANIFLLLAGVLIVVGGIWLVDARKSEICFESGRRDCNAVSRPVPTRD